MALPIFQRTVTDDAGNIVVGATVTVKYESTGLTASIFSDRAGTAALTNPFPTDENGLALFYAAPGEYRIEVSSGAFALTWRYYVITGTTDDISSSRRILFNSISEMLLGTLPSGGEHVFVIGQMLTVREDHDYLVIDGSDYTVKTSVDYTLKGGLVAQRRNNGTLVTSRESYQLEGESPYLTLTNKQRVKDRSYTGSANPGISITGEDNQVTNIAFEVDVSGGVTQAVYLREGSVSPIIDKNFFKGVGYQIIQASGEYTSGVRAVLNTSKDCVNDFFLQNNDSQNGITHGNIVALNSVDHTNSTVPYGATEARGVSFTTCYGGLNALNSLVGIKGDSATHLENIQETVHALNYYRDNLTDILFSGLTDRKLISLDITGGSDTIEVGDVITSSSGGSGSVLFWFDENEIAQVIDITGSFVSGDTFTVTSKDVVGSVVYRDDVQVHANSIGNVFHKTGSETRLSLNGGVNNYTLMMQSIGDTFNCQVKRGVANTVAVTAVYTSAITMTNEAFRGWDTAIDCVPYANLIKTKDSNFWNNGNVLLGGQLLNSEFCGNTVFDGNIDITDLQKSKVCGNTFFKGSVSIAGSGNTWRDNSVTTDVSIDKNIVNAFDVWDSKNYKKNGRSHYIKSENTFSADGSDVNILLATAQPELSASGSVIINWSIASRTSTDGANRSGRVGIAWVAGGPPVITVDSVEAFGSGGLTFEAVADGSNALLNFKYPSLGLYADGVIELDILTSTVIIIPENFLDIIT